MNAADRKRARLYAIGQEIREQHISRKCGRRGCDCLKRYERTRAQYRKLLEADSGSGDAATRARNSRRAGRS